LCCFPLREHFALSVAWPGAHASASTILSEAEALPLVVTAGEYAADARQAARLKLANTILSLAGETPEFGTLKESALRIMRLR
jgi:hypothetical protein